jgi:hypothetical protein
MTDQERAEQLRCEEQALRCLLESQRLSPERRLDIEQCLKLLKDEIAEASLKRAAGAA